MNPKKILIIEDEEYIRDLYKRQLTKAGFVADGVGTGKEGMDALQKNDYDLILLDIMLPDVNGLQILKEVKSNDRTKKILVVLLTNLGQDIVIKEGFELGAEGYLLKASYTPNQIVEEVKNMLEGRKPTNPPPQTV